MSFAPGYKVEGCYTEDCLNCNILALFVGVSQEIAIHARQLLEDLTHDWNLLTETKVAGRNVWVRTAVVQMLLPC